MHLIKHLEQLLSLLLLHVQLPLSLCFLHAQLQQLLHFLMLLLQCFQRITILIQPIPILTLHYPINIIFFLRNLLVVMHQSLHPKVHHSLIQYVFSCTNWHMIIYTFNPKAWLHICILLKFQRTSCYHLRSNFLIDNHPIIPRIHLLNKRCVIRKYFYVNLHNLCTRKLHTILNNVLWYSFCNQCNIY